MPSSAGGGQGPRARWWPALVILLGLGGWLAQIWLGGGDDRQDQTVRTMAATLLSGLLLALWFLFVSRLRGRVRVFGGGVMLAAVMGGALLFRIVGVSGNLVPIVALRWSARPSAPPSPAPPAEIAPSAEAAPPATAAIPAGSVGPAVRATPPAATVEGAEYPQFLGPGRDGVLAGPRLGRDWQARPPRLVWRRSVGAGWSGFAIASGRAVTQEQQGDDELVVAYDANTGAVLWRHADRARYDTVVAGVGPRATPTIQGNRVYTMGATGILNALALDTGAKLWSRNVLEENGSTNPSWGTSGSPLLTGDRVVVSAGGSDGRSLVAYVAESGEPAWRSGHDRQSYSSAVVASLAGRRQILILNHASVAGHDEATGALLWEMPWPGEQPSVANPLVLGPDRVLFSAGYGVGSKLYEVTAPAGGRLVATLLWESPRLKAKFTNLVVLDGLVYGLDDGVLVCLDPADGQRKWRDGRYGHGQVLLVDRLLLVQTEEGEVVLVEPNPTRLSELTRFTAFETKTWNPPALAGRRLFLRTDREAVVYDLPVE